MEPHTEKAHFLWVTTNGNGMLAQKLLGQPLLPSRDLYLMAAMPAAAGPPAMILVPPLGPPSWQELYESADHVFSTLVMPYTILSAVIFNSVDPPDTLLNKLKRMALELPVIMAMISDEGPDWISLLKKL